MKVFTAAFGTETNSFSPLPTGWQSFEEGILLRPGEHGDEVTEVTVPLWLCREKARRDGWHVIEGTCAFAAPGGPTVRRVYESLRDEILGQLEAALPVDMVALSLHGAMIAEGYDDCEGDFLSRIRKLVGPTTRIGAELDPHAHLSRAMVDSADILIFFKEYPHTDFIERGRELMALLEDACAGRVTPHMSVFDCRMIGAYHTTVEPMRSFLERVRRREVEEGILSISIVHSFPWGDVPDMGTKILVVTDDRPELGARCAAELGGELVALRGKTSARFLSMDAAFERLRHAAAGPVVVADRADNPGAGAPGDATFMLERALSEGVQSIAFAPLYDPEAVRYCFEAGEGARFHLRIGGKLGATSGRPLDVVAEVRKLDRDLVVPFAGTEIRMGRAAAIHFSGIDVVLTSLREQALARELFIRMGIDGRHILVVKSAQHFHDSFKPHAAEILYVDAPGTASGDLTSFPFRKIERPKWPFDEDPFSGGEGARP